MSLCESKIGTDHLMLQDPCKSEASFTVYHQAKVLLVGFPIVVTTTYRVKIEPLGFALGRHLYSLPLTPGEEVEIEVFRSAKVERELSQQFSTEVEFTEEYSHACKYEWSKERQSNYEEGGGVSGKIDLGIIEFGGQKEDEYSETEREFQRVIGEVVHKTKLRVDRKFDMHVGLKTEVENRYRSIRKIRNPNLCRTLTYNYFQLMRKVKVTITRTKLRFDWLRRPLRILETAIPAVIRSYAMPSIELRQLVTPREERPESAEPARLQPASATSATPVGMTPMPTSVAYTSAPELQTSTPAVRTLAHPIIREPHVLELTKQRVLAKMELMKIFKKAEEKRRLNAAIEGLRRKFPVGRVVSEQEICINTNSMHVEPMMGLCLACEGHKLELAKVELDTAKAELDKLKETNSDNGS